MNRSETDVEVADFYTNGSLINDSNAKHIRTSKPAYDHEVTKSTNRRKAQDQRSNTQNQVTDVYNEGYYTDHVISDSMHEETETEVMQPSSKNKHTKKTKATNPRKDSKSENNSDDWSADALDEFLETLRKQPVKEMTDRRNKWVFFAQRLNSKKDYKKDNEDCRRQVIATS